MTVVDGPDREQLAAAMEVQNNAFANALDDIEKRAKAMFPGAGDGHPDPQAAAHASAELDALHAGPSTTGDDLEPGRRRAYEEVARLLGPPGQHASDLEGLARLLVEDPHYVAKALENLEHPEVYFVVEECPKAIEKPWTPPVTRRAPGNRTPRLPPNPWSRASEVEKR